jgi:hypothetical protein
MAQQGCEPTVLAVLAVSRLRHLALLFHPEQEPIFHQQPQCLFMEMRRQGFDERVMEGPQNIRQEFLLV